MAALLALNVHFQLLFLNGVTITTGKCPIFQRIKAPTGEELTGLVQQISDHIARMLERNGLIERDQDKPYLDLDGLEQDGISQLQSHSISYRIAIGPRKGQKALTLQTLQAQPPTDVASGLVGKVTGFSLHAGVAAKAHERSKVERHCRYGTKPPVAETRLSLTENGKIRVELKTPYRDGTTHIIFEPLDFIARLAAMVPKPRVNLTRFHGDYAPNCKLRSVITSGGKKKAAHNKKKKINDDQSDVSRRAAKDARLHT